MVDGMDDGMNYIMTCISFCKHSSKSELWSEEELLKEKLVSSKKSQLLRNESRIMIGGLSKKGYDISENESISETWGNYFTMELME